MLSLVPQHGVIGIIEGIEVQVIPGIADRQLFIEVNGLNIGNLPLFPGNRLIARPARNIVGNVQLGAAGRLVCRLKVDLKAAIGVNLRLLQPKHTLWDTVIPGNRGILTGGGGAVLRYSLGTGLIRLVSAEHCAQGLRLVWIDYKEGHRSHKYEEEEPYCN